MGVRAHHLMIAGNRHVDADPDADDEEEDGCAKIERCKKRHGIPPEAEPVDERRGTCSLHKMDHVAAAGRGPLSQPAKRTLRPPDCAFNGNREPGMQVECGLRKSVLETVVHPVRLHAE